MTIEKSSTIKLESAEERYQRYLDAKNRSIVWHGLLEDVYEFVAPDRARFNKSSEEGTSTANEIFDATPVMALKHYANNIQGILMPPMQQYVSLEPGNALQNTNAFSDDELETISKKLQEDTKTIFRNLENCESFYTTVNEALEDAGISTGAILINEGTQDEPLEFKTVPVSTLSVEESVNGKLETVWQDIQVKARLIEEMWALDNISSRIKTIIDNEPNKDVDLVHGCIHYPRNPIGKKYYYYVQDPTTHEDMYGEWRDYNPFTVFRIHKAPTEAFGRGIAMLMLPFIKVLNKMAEFILKSAKFHAFPAYLAENSGALNPYNITIEPGAIIPVDKGFAKSPPIMPIQAGGSPQFAELSIQDLRSQINEAFFANPLGYVTQVKDRTATEMQLRRQQWVEQNAVATGRIANELIKPLFQKVTYILRKKGILHDIQTSKGAMAIGINNKEVQINYKSPLIGIQDQTDAANFENWSQIMIKSFGSMGMVTMELAKVPFWLAKKMGVDLSLVSQEAVIKEKFDQIQQQASQQQLSQQKLQEVAQEPEPPASPVGQLPELGAFQ